MKCLRCKRELKSLGSIEKGYGQLCMKKHKEERLSGYFKDTNKTHMDKI